MGVLLLLLMVALGYYIHSCQKMRYKGNYRPQYILGKTQPGSVNQPVLLHLQSLITLEQTQNHTHGTHWMVN